MACDKHGSHLTIKPARRFPPLLNGVYIVYARMEGMPTDVVGYVGGGLKLIELSGLGHLDYKETKYLKDDTWIYF